MSETSFIEKMAKHRQEALNGLLALPDGDPIRHARARGHIAGLDEAMKIFRNENKTDDEETHT